jgi:Putative peptidoglycan binding domain
VPETRESTSPLDDWLGDISDDDWSEKPTEPVRGRATTRTSEPRAREGIPPYDTTAARAAPARPVAAAEARRAVIGRRRIVAGVVLAILLGIGIATPVVLLTGGEQATVTQPTVTVTTTQPVDTSPTTDPGTTTTSPTTEQTTTTPTEDAPSFVLPEGTKLQREGENDPTLVSELQEALAEAGFAPGPADGTFGEQTEAAVVAFQQANGLSVDGRVGPETAEALNQALARG